MKNKILLLLTLFLVNKLSFGQLLQASLGAGSQPNTIKVYIKSPLAFTPTNISTLQFNIGIATTVTPIPIATVRTSAISGVTWTIEPAVSEGGYYNYAVQTASSPLAFNLAANTEFEVMEISFSGGPLNPQNVSLITLPGGGLGITNGKALFLSTGIPFSVGTNLYFTRSGTVVQNLFSYNETDGTAGTGTSTATIGGVILPTKFLSFFANKSDDNAKLTWTVDNEEDNSYFEVEASKDARTFNKILKVDALRNGRSSNTYNTTDIQISRYNVSTVYYRIKQVEASGKITYTDVRQVNLDSKNFVAALYPNPVKTVTKLMIEAPEAAKATVIIRDAAGKAVKQLNLQLQKGTNQQNLDVTSLAAGDYNVTVVSDKLNQTIKMTKSN